MCPIKIYDCLTKIIERIVYRASLDGLVPKNSKTQAGLDHLATGHDFKVLLKKKIKERSRELSGVEVCMPNLYRACLNRSEGIRNDDTVIEIRHAEFTKDEVTALVAFFEFQDRWTFPLAWKEVPNA